MDVTETPLPGVLRIRPTVHRDHRGSFMETWRRRRYVDAGLPADFAQDNVATSRQGVLRGLHYQYPEPQAKLITVLAGRVYDVAVDVRRGSPRFGEWYGTELSDDGTQLWIPEGFAHGYVVLSGAAVLTYKCTRPYNPDGDRGIRWDDPAIGIEWPVEDPVLSEKDAAAVGLREVREDDLPEYGG